MLARSTTPPQSSSSSPEDEVREEPPDRIARPSDPHSLHHARVLELIEDHVWEEAVCNLLSVGLDAADKVGVGLAKSGHQGMKGVLEGRGRGREGGRADRNSSQEQG